MVAKITHSSSIQRALNYNEQKVKEARAKCLYAHQFLQRPNKLPFHAKLERFQRLTTLNKRAATNAIHISLNFSVGEKLGEEKLTEIAKVYMQKIGFDAQPYLVYEHSDAGHPHIHIVSTNIQQDGSRISLHNLGRNQSSKARKEIERAYGLVRAENRCNEPLKEEIQPFPQKIIYGRQPTKRGITNILDHVLPKYQYSSLSQLNAVLNQFNLMADRGSEESIVFRKGGLVYRVLDEKGQKTGVPVKASSLYNKPTLRYLEGRFGQNEASKRQHKQKIKTTIDWVLLKAPKELEDFKRMLEVEKISLVTRQNSEGLIYGLTYIDHQTKSVFNGSEIGKEYSAHRVLQKLAEASQTPVQKTMFSSLDKAQPSPSTQRSLLPEEPLNDPKVFDFMTPAQDNSGIPSDLKKKKKKKRRSL